MFIKYIPGYWFVMGMQYSRHAITFTRYKAGGIAYVLTYTIRLVPKHICFFGHKCMAYSISYAPARWRAGRVYTSKHPA